MANGSQAAALGEAAAERRDLATWWRNFTRPNRRDESQGGEFAADQSCGIDSDCLAADAPVAKGDIFGVPLHESIKYANVAISLYDENGKSFIYGYVPIVVAKCGVYLKEQATDVEGIFRVAGAERRIKELQNIFNSPDRYGKGLDWSGYTVNDAANVLRRYLRQLPEPIIPLDFYQRFRDPIRHHQAAAVGQLDHQEEDRGTFDADNAIRTYQSLITELPPLNRQLLLYLLDLLAVFASKADVNRMNSYNLSAIFQPGILSHPEHELSPKDYRLNQDVLIFLIEHQDHFLVGMQGTAADEKTIQEVQNGPAKQPATPPTPKARVSQGVGRSASTASAGAESVRRFGGMRRNVSVSSKQSRKSGASPSPGTPPTAEELIRSGSTKSGGVHRSNTVPSKKSPSPALGHGRFQRDKSPEPAKSSPLANQASTNASADARNASVTSTQSGRMSPHLRPVPLPGRRDASKDRQLRMEMPSGPRTASPSGTPSRERTFSNFFRQSPGAENEKRDSSRKPNKLQKKRPDGTAIATGTSSTALNSQSSNQSLSGISHPPSPGFAPALDAIPAAQVEGPTESDFKTENIQTAGIPQPQARDFASPHTQASVPEAVPTAPATVSANEIAPPSAPSTLTEKPKGDGVITEGAQQPSTALRDLPQRSSGTTLKATATAPASQLSHAEGSFDGGSHDLGDDESGMTGESKEEKKHRRWKFSKSEKRVKSPSASAAGHDAHAGGVSSNTLAASSLGSSAALGGRSTSSMGSYGKPRKSFTDESKESSIVSTPAGFNENDASSNSPEGKKGPIGWFKGKLQDRRDRAKSPPPSSQRTTSPGPQKSIDLAVASTSASKASLHEEPQAPGSEELTPKGEEVPTQLKGILEGKPA